MPVIFQKMISRHDLIRNRSVLYVFGDNLQRKGFGGQAAQMRGEPNAVGIATKLSPQYFFTESEADVRAQNRHIDKDMEPLFAHVKQGGIVVWPADGIGTGLAQLDIQSPSTFEYLKGKLAALLLYADQFDPYKRPTEA